MEKNLLLNDYWTDKLASVYEHIKLDCDPDDYDHGHVHRGLIVVDDETGELLASVKEALKYDELAVAGKVNEITVDEQWPLGSTEKCKDKLLAEALKINHGLLVVNVNDIRIFNKHTRSIKWLAKQEHKVFSFLEAKDVKLNEYVLLVIKDIPWTKVKDYAMKHTEGEFDAMMQFYDRIRPREDRSCYQ